MPITGESTLCCTDAAPVGPALMAEPDTEAPEFTLPAGRLCVGVVETAPTPSEDTE